MALEQFEINLGGKPRTIYGYANDRYMQTLQYQADENWSAWVARVITSVTLYYEAA